MQAINCMMVIATINISVWCVWLDFCLVSLQATESADHSFPSSSVLCYHLHLPPAASEAFHLHFFHQTLFHVFLGHPHCLWPFSWRGFGPIHYRQNLSCGADLCSRLFHRYKPTITQVLLLLETEFLSVCFDWLIKNSILDLFSECPCQLNKWQRYQHSKVAEN